MSWFNLSHPKPLHSPGSPTVTGLLRPELGSFMPVLLLISVRRHGHILTFFQQSLFAVPLLCLPGMRAMPLPPYFPSIFHVFLLEIYRALYLFAYVRRLAGWRKVCRLGNQTQTLVDDPNDPNSSSFCHMTWQFQSLKTRVYSSDFPGFVHVAFFGPWSSA